MDRPEREILVHISAPSGAKDDARHLAQAESYFTFEAVSRIKIFPGSDDDDSFENQRDQDLEAGDNAAKDEDGTKNFNGEVRWIEELENIESTASSPRRRPYPNRLTTRSFTAPSPQQCLGSGQEIQTSQKRCLGLKNHRVHSAPLSPVQAVSSISNPLPVQNTEGVDSLDFLPSVVEDSQPALLSLIEREDDYEPGQEEGSSQGCSMDRSDKYKSQSIDIYLSPSKRRRLGNHNSQDQTTDITQSFPVSISTTLGSASRRESFDMSLSRLASFCQSEHSARSGNGGGEDVWSSPPVLLPLEIHPLPPEASSMPFKTHITPTMQMLSDRLGLSRVFKPIQKARDLRILERGYWLLKVKIVNQNTSEIQHKHGNYDSVWPLSLFIRFWSFLADFIGRENRAGWGVWCVREPQNLPRGEIVELHSPRVEHVKIYTWGEIVPHVYLLLFLASERQIKGMCAQWRDAKDEVVVQMS